MGDSPKLVACSGIGNDTEQSPSPRTIGRRKRWKPRRVTEDGDQLALAAGFDPEHAEPVLFVVEGDALDEPG